ncbi:MAG: hypothetical protein ACPGVO_14525 [Spirulinaceae cyanobacterium]
MSEEVVQWLAEIRSLKTQLAEAQRDRDAAQASADHWRSTYNTEARQRREDIQAAQARIAALEAQIAQLQQPKPAPTQPKVAAFAAELAPLKSEAQLRSKLIELLYERDRAREALKKEQKNHRHTRQNLTAVIGDTMDQLTRLRGTPPPPLTEAELPPVASKNRSEPEVEVLPSPQTPPSQARPSQASRPPSSPPPSTTTGRAPTIPDKGKGLDEQP